MPQSLTVVGIARPPSAMTDILGSLRFRYRSFRLPMPFPPLPTELIRHILELAAEDISVAHRLVLVSKSVRAWVTPLLYQTVTLRTSEQVQTFYDHLVSQPTKSQATLLVKNLSMRCLSSTSAYPLNRTLRACPLVNRLVIDSLQRLPLRREPGMSWPAPWEVIFLYGAASWVTLSHPVLRDVTHLHLDDVLFQSTFDACKRSCPRLTHIGVSYSHTHNNVVNGANFVRLIRWLLSSTPSLQMVLLHSFVPHPEPSPHIADFSDNVWHELAKIDDDRLLVRPGLQEGEYQAMLRTGSSVWDDAGNRFGSWRMLVKASRRT